MTQVEWLRSLLSDPNRRKPIGSAWPLFFHLLFRIDEKGKWTTTYEQLSGELGLPQPTVKTWRKLLVSNSVVKSYMGKHEVTFELLSPFCPTAVFEENKNDGAQGGLGEAQESKGGAWHERQPALDGLALAPLMPLVVDLAQRITRLEMQTEVRFSRKTDK